jgi:hypothetical protein
MEAREDHLEEMRQCDLVPASHNGNKEKFDDKKFLFRWSKEKLETIPGDIVKIVSIGEFIVAPISDTLYYLQSDFLI